MTLLVRKMQILAMFFVFFIFPSMMTINAFIWPLDSVIHETRALTLSEGHMFASNAGPVTSEYFSPSTDNNNQLSIITVNSIITTYSKRNESFEVVYAAYGAFSESWQELAGLCDLIPLQDVNPWAVNINQTSAFSTYFGIAELNDDFLIHMNITTDDYIPSETTDDLINTISEQQNKQVEEEQEERNEKYRLAHATYHHQIMSESSSPTATNSNNVNTPAPTIAPSTVTTSNPTATATASPTATTTLPPTVIITNNPTSSPTNNNNKFGDNSYYVWKTHITNTYYVTAEGWYGSTFQTCTTDPSVSSVEGTISYKNPYGYLPAEYFGILPFQALRVVLLTLLTLIFSIFRCRFRDSLLPLHNGILAVCIISLFDSCICFLAYYLLNQSGQPECCPFAPPMIATLTIQIFRQTFCRVLLLVISLGYGIARPKLSNYEWSMVAAVAVGYLVTSIFAEMSEIKFEDSNPYGNPSRSTSLTLFMTLATFMDCIFMVWIFTALSSTMRILTEFRQTYKVQLYQNITNIVLIFTVIFLVATLLISFDVSGALGGAPWQMKWLSLVIWDVLNYAVLAAICIVCRPNSNSQLLSYATQLPTNDDDDDENEDIEDGQLDSYNDYDEHMMLPNSNISSGMNEVDATSPSRFTPISASTRNPIVLKFKAPTSSARVGSNDYSPSSSPQLANSSSAGGGQQSGYSKVNSSTTSPAAVYGHDNDDDDDDQEFGNFSTLPPPSSNRK